MARNGTERNEKEMRYHSYDKKLKKMAHIEISYVIFSEVNKIVMGKQKPTSFSNASALLNSRHNSSSSNGDGDNTTKKSGILVASVHHSTHASVCVCMLLDSHRVCLAGKSNFTRKKNNDKSLRCIEFSWCGNAVL